MNKKFTDIPYINNDDAIVTAAGAGDIQILKFLLNNKCNINTQNEYGETSLMVAIESGYTEIALYLIKKGININLANNFGDYALDYVIFYKNRDKCDEIEKELKSLDAKNNGYKSHIRKQYESLSDLEPPQIINFIKNNKKS